MIIQAELRRKQSEYEKLDALEFSLRKKGSSVQRRMQEALKNLYEQEVAAPVREYLESKSAPAVRPKRTVRGSKPQAGTPAGELMRKAGE